MNLMALMLLPTIMQPLPAIMPFHDVDQREHKQQQVWQLPINKFKANSVVNEINSVNDYWNHTISYRLNPEKWQTPEETFEAGTGDCKDYAMAKYYSLRYLGVPAADMKFTVVVWRNKWHAVLVVDGLVLDSMTDKVKLLDDVDDYEAAYSVNEDNLWSLTKLTK